MKRLLIIISLAALLSFGYKISVTPSYDTIDIASALEQAKKTLKTNQTIVLFESKNPFNFYDIFNRITDISKQQVFGILTKPDTVGLFPIIIGLAGSDGWAKHHYAYLERYLDMGFAVFSLHSFKSRGVESTVGEQLTVTIPMMIHDTFMALNKLSEDKNIDATRAGLTGWSLGGGVTLFAAWAPIQEVISPDLKFSAHLPFYPPCMVIPDVLKFNDVPIHILAGELDDWVPAKACEELVEAANNSGNDLDITIYPGASHSFDRTMEVVLDDYAYSFTDCRLKLTDDGIVRMINGFPLSSPTLQKIALAFCAEKGAHWGGDKDAREMSSSFAMEFMKKHLIN